MERYTQLVVALGLLFQPIFLAAQQIPPPPAGYGARAADVVVDMAGVLSPATIARINSLAWELREKTGGELAVVTLPDLSGRDVAEVALRIGREWGVGANAPIGSRTRNAGVVVLVVPKETSRDGRGHVRIEVGRGAESFLTDAIAGDIQRAAIPFFRARDYDSGVLYMVGEIAARFSAEFGVSLAIPQTKLPEVEQSPVEVPSAALPLAALIMALLVVAVLAQARAAGKAVPRRKRAADDVLSLLWLIAASSGQRGRRGAWTGGFGGGSFGSGGGFGGFGGGGGFSGGGSSGSW